MEIEEKLKEAATWQPKDEMPIGLERRAFAQRRPPLRPIGLARPALSTLLAAAACGFLIHLTGTPETVVSTPLPSATPRIETPVAVPTHPITISAVPKKKTDPVAAAPRVRRRAVARSTRKQIRVAAEEPIVVQSRVPVDEPVYAPAYYAQPSADGTSVEFTPVVATLGDPDVIYTPQE